MAQHLYDEAVKVFDDQDVSVQNKYDFFQENILADKNLITFTYSECFGNKEGPMHGMCRVFERNIAFPDLYKLCELRSADGSIVGG